MNAPVRKGYSIPPPSDPFWTPVPDAGAKGSHSRTIATASYKALLLPSCTTTSCSNNKDADNQLPGPEGGQQFILMTTGRMTDFLKPSFRKNAAPAKMMTTGRSTPPISSNRPKSSPAGRRTPITSPSPSSPGSAAMRRRAITTTAMTTRTATPTTPTAVTPRMASRSQEEVAPALTPRDLDWYIFLRTLKLKLLCLDNNDGKSISSPSPRRRSNPAIWMVLLCRRPQEQAKAHPQYNAHSAEEDEKKENIEDDGGRAAQDSSSDIKREILQIHGPEDFVACLHKWEKEEEEKKKKRKKRRCDDEGRQGWLDAEGRFDSHGTIYFLVGEL